MCHNKLKVFFYFPPLQDKHKEACTFSTVKCPFQGCGQVLHRSKIDSHEETCDYRYSECLVCNVYVDWKEDKVFRFFLVFFLISDFVVKVLLLIFLNVELIGSTRQYFTLINRDENPGLGSVIQVFDHLLFFTYLYSWL